MWHGLRHGFGNILHGLLDWCFITTVRAWLEHLILNNCGPWMHRSMNYDVVPSLTLRFKDLSWLWVDRASRPFELDREWISSVHLYDGISRFHRVFIMSFWFYETFVSCIWSLACRGQESKLFYVNGYGVRVSCVELFP